MGRDSSLVKYSFGHVQISCCGHSEELRIFQCRWQDRVYTDRTLKLNFILIKVE